MPDIGYYTLPVIPSFAGITAKIQSDLDKAFKGAGENAGKILGQSAAAAFGKEPSLEKAMGSAPASMTVLTSATDKQADAVGRLQAAHKQLASAMGTPDEQTRVITTQDKHTDSLRKSEAQVKRVTTANDALTRAVRQAGQEQIRQANEAQQAADKITAKTSGSLADQLKRDAGKALGGDSGGALGDLGDQLGKAIGAKVGGTLRDTVKDVTGMSVDTISDKVKGAGAAVGVDLQGALTKAFSGDRAGALGDIGTQLGTKAGTAAANFARGGLQDLTGIDIGGLPGMQQAGDAAQGWLSGGGTDQILGFLSGGGIGRAAGGARGLLGALRQPGGIRGALGAGRDALQGADLGNILGNVNDFTGGGAQDVIDLHSGITDVAEGVLGGTAAEKFLPAIGEAALPVAVGAMGGKWLSDKFEHGPARSQVEGAYDDTGTATNSFERNMESIPGIGSFLGPSQDLREANMRARDAQVGSGESFYTSVFGNDRSGIGAGGGGGGGPTSTGEMNVEASVATISAGSVTVGGSISLPGLTVGGGGGGGGGGSRSAPIVGSASAHSSGEDSLYGGDSGGSYFAGGGPIGTDTIPLWGSPGEWMIQKSAADYYGPTAMSHINAGTFAGGGPIDGTRGTDPHKGPKGSASDPIYTMPSEGFTHAINQQAGPRSGGGAGGGLGGGAGDAFNAAGGVQGLMGIGQQAASDMIPGFGNLGSDPLVQSGMNMMQAALGMAMQPGGIMGALTADDAGKRTFGGLLGGGGGAPGGGFGMIPQVAGMPHPDDMASSPSDAAFGDALSTSIGGGATHVDNSTTLNVNGFSAGEVGNQVYRALGSSGVPTNTPRMQTNMPAGAK